METPKIERLDMHIPDTNLTQALMEARIAEAEQTAQREWSKANSPSVWKRIAGSWHAVKDELSNNPRRHPPGGHWYHRSQHH